MTRASRQRTVVSYCHETAYGRIGAIRNGCLSTGIGCRQIPATVCQSTSARCELTSTVCKPTSVVRQLTSTRIQLPGAGETDIGRMAIDIAPLRIASDSMATGIRPSRIAATRRRSTSPRCELTSARCTGPTGRLPVLHRRCDVTPARSVRPVASEGRQAAFTHSHSQQEV